MSSGCKTPVEWWFCGFISWRISINQSVQYRGTTVLNTARLWKAETSVRVVAMIARHGDSETFLLLMLTKNWLSGFGFHIFSLFSLGGWNRQPAWLLPHRSGSLHQGILRCCHAWNWRFLGISQNWMMGQLTGAPWYFKHYCTANNGNPRGLRSRILPEIYQNYTLKLQNFTRSTHGFVPTWKLPKYLLQRCVTVVLSSTQQSQ